MTDIRRAPKVPVAGVSSLWTERPNGDLQLRVTDDSWLHVRGSSIISMPMGITRGRAATPAAALRAAEMMYRADLRHQLERARRMILTANAGLARLTTTPEASPVSKPDPAEGAQT